MPKVYIAADHAGFVLKEELKPFIGELGYDVEDCGAFEEDPADDYPDVVLPCAQKVAADTEALGIIIGASGQGEAMAANRVKGVRAAVYYGPAALEQTDADGTTLNLIESARAHNGANVLSLGARFLLAEDARAAVALFLKTPVGEGERHLRRRAKLDLS